MHPLLNLESCSVVRYIVCHERESLYFMDFLLVSRDPKTHLPQFQHVLLLPCSLMNQPLNVFSREIFQLKKKNP